MGTGYEHATFQTSRRNIKRGILVKKIYVKQVDFFFKFST